MSKEHKLFALFLQRLSALANDPEMGCHMHTEAESISVAELALEQAMDMYGVWRERAPDFFDYTPGDSE